MTSNEIREKFLKFFEERGHKRIPSSSLSPNDSSVLFTTAGMQQFKPYYTNPKSAEKDFGTKNVVTVQKCVRTSDIEEVGDNTHLTFFEMLGNFSFGGYGRKEAIEYAHEFITKEMNLKISYVTVYEGNDNVPKDIESKEVWEGLGIKNIKEEGDDLFWGPTGDSGPCGPTTEIYCKNGLNEDVEIWNIVFNEYFCNGSRESLNKGKIKLTKLPILGIDTGMGLERLVVSIQNKKNVYETDLFDNEKTKEEKIIADHIKASLFMISDGITPSNTGAGYVLRRIIRRAIRFSKKPSVEVVQKVINVYKNIYKLDDKEVIKKEENKFRKTLDKGLKEFEKGIDPFILFTTYGFPIELTLELAKEKGIEIDIKDFDKKLKKHQKLSQTACVGMFKGGLADNDENTIKLHTAHHLLLAGLQAVVNSNIKQRGSNINRNRLRIDFMCDHKLTDEEKKKTEDWVNDKIKKELKMVQREIPLVKAEKVGAQMEFGKKYPDIVSIYFAEDEEGNSYSKEFCGGPHVENTRELGTFTIKKEESVASGIRRIKAILK